MLYHNSMKRVEIALIIHPDMESVRKGMTTSTTEKARTISAKSV